MCHKIIGQFDNINLLPGMDWNMGGAFVKTKSGNRWVNQTDWVLKDEESGLFIVMSNYEYRKQYLNNKTTTMQDQKPDSGVAQTRELTFGEKACGISFNPSKDPKVDEIKQTCAAAIDAIYGSEDAPGVEATNDERSRMIDLAITRIQEGQMWAVKAQTWQR